MNPRNVFEPGFYRIYIFYEFNRINWAVPVTRALYHDGVLLSVTQETWSGFVRGRGYYFFFEQEGFAPGDYEVQFFVGDELSARATFTVREF